MSGVTNNRQAERTGEAEKLRAFKDHVHLRLRGYKEAVASGDLPTGSIWLVRVIEAGKSLNGPVYLKETLQAAVPVFEGAPVFCYALSPDDGDHLNDAQQSAEPRGLVGHQIGALENVHWNEDEGALDAYLKVYDDKIRTRMLAAYKLGDIGEGGRRDVFGLSIDAQGDSDDQGNVVRITAANSVDLVSTPAAGGRVRRLVASAGTGSANTEVTLENSMPETIRENLATFAGSLKQYADQLSTAEDGTAGPILEKLMGEVQAAMLEYAETTDSPMGESETTNPSDAQEGSDVTHEQNAPAAQQDEFARMSAGLTEALKRDDLTDEARVVLQEALGQQPDEDAKDKKIRALQERLAQQAIEAELGRLQEDLNLVDPALVLRLIDRAKVQVNDDYSEVSGLKEAIEEFVADKPYLIAAPAADDAEAARQTESDDAGTPAQATVPTAPTAPVPTAPAPAAEVETLGAVALRESVRKQYGTSPDRARARMRQLRKKLLQGKEQYAAEYRALQSVVSGL